MMPGRLRNFRDPVRFEGQPSNGDVAVDEAYDYLGITHDFSGRAIIVIRWTTAD